MSLVEIEYPLSGLRCASVEEPLVDANYLGRLKPVPGNPGQSHENGAIESRHDSLKTALDQALRLRGTWCFDTREA